LRVPSPWCSKARARNEPAPTAGRPLGPLDPDSRRVIGAASSPGPEPLVRPRVAPPMLVIRPTSGWRSLDLREVWRFRDLLLMFAVRDLKLRYRQTALGVAWVVILPLLGAGVFALVFGRVAKLPSAGVPYFLLAYAGLLGWNLFQGTLTRAGGSLITNAPLISKVYFPRVIVPLSAAVSACVDTLVAMGLLVILLPAYHVALTPAVLLVPLWLLLLQVLGLGLSLYASALSVSYRDVSHILPVLVQFLLYASPVGYRAAQVPHAFQAVYLLNPLAGLLEGLRWSLLGGTPPRLGAVLYAAAVSCVVLVVGAFAFRRMERRFADVL
jgi:lipopolysaccharide transport system permease protein